MSALKVAEKLDFWKELQIIIKNKNYLLLTVTFTFLYGLYTSLGAVVSSITSPFGYDSFDNSIFGASFIFCGVVGSFIIGVMLDKYAKYKLTLNIISTGACFFIVLAYWTLQSQNVALFSVNLAFAGFCIISVIPCSYAFSIELTYPVPESMANGMMITVS